MDQSQKRKYPDNNDNDGPVPMDIDMQVDVVAQAKLVNGIVSKTFDEKLEDEYGSECAISLIICPIFSNAALDLLGSNAFAFGDSMPSIAVT
ncbi:Hypothetical predicted protein [Paramuricea clavata]|uniref:Uncharacterized protein n=2 Tax=Paramuricea clavata TaxID=317549 RepID=A0A6S7GKQ3_PARCT|nr:Hypothetical predicted protein [Paramuricea clavata]